MKKLVLMSIFLSVPMVVLSDDGKRVRKTKVCHYSALILGDNFSTCMVEPLTLKKARVIETDMKKVLEDDLQGVQRRILYDTLRSAVRLDDPNILALAQGGLEAIFSNEDLLNKDLLEDCNRLVRERMHKIIQELEREEEQEVQNGETVERVTR